MSNPQELERIAAEEITKIFNTLFIQKSNPFPLIVNYMNNTVNGIPMEKLYRLQNDIKDFADEAVKKLTEEVPKKKEKLPRKVRNW